MFDRFIRLARARKSLADGRFVDALRQASDPVVEADRRAEQVRARASAGILARAARSLERGEVAAAKREAQHLQQWQPGAEVEDLLARCEAALAASAEAMAARRAAAEEDVLLGEARPREHIVSTCEWMASTYKFCAHDDRKFCAHICS